jgi:thiol-disulfide isomerase/thioredoxin
MRLVTLLVLCCSCATAPRGAVATGEVDARLAGLKGQVVLVDFFASWCEPCRKSLPFYRELKQRHPGGFEILAVSVDEDEGDLQRFLERVGPLPFPVTRDASGASARRFGVERMPTSVLLDGAGAEVYRGGGFEPEAVSAAVARAVP